MTVATRAATIIVFMVISARNVSQTYRSGSQPLTVYNVDNGDGPIIISGQPCPDGSLPRLQGSTGKTRQLRLLERGETGLQGS